MILIVCSLFISLSLIPLFSTNNKTKQSRNNNGSRIKFLYISFGVLLVFILAFRGEGVDRDYGNYENIFFLNSDQNSGSWSILIEPSFILISKLIQTFFNNNVIVLFVIYAFLGVSIKMYAIKQLSQFWALSLLLYLSYSFTLHDMTQIRAGVASGFILLCIKPLYERKLVNFLALSICATLFHYSAIIVLFLWFLNPQKINVKIYGLIIILAYLFYLFSSIYISEILKYIPISLLQNKILAYEYDNEGSLNVFNVWQIMRILLSFLFLWNIKQIQEKNKYGILLLKLYIFSTSSYVLLAANPSFAGRISDLFAISDIVMVPCILYFIKPNSLAKIIVISIAFSYLFLNLFFNKIIT